MTRFDYPGWFPENYDKGMQTSVAKPDPIFWVYIRPSGSKFGLGWVGLNYFQYDVLSGWTGFNPTTRNLFFPQNAKPKFVKSMLKMNNVDQLLLVPIVSRLFFIEEYLIFSF